MVAGVKRRFFQGSIVQKPRNVVKSFLMASTLIDSKRIQDNMEGYIKKTSFDDNFIIDHYFEDF